MEPLYNEVLGTMKITLLYQVSRYIRVKKQRNIKSLDHQNDLVIRGFCYIQPLYNEVPLYTCILYTCTNFQRHLGLEREFKEICQNLRKLGSSKKEFQLQAVASCAEKASVAAAIYLGEFNSNNLFTDKFHFINQTSVFCHFIV